jgi:hypothetical protein
MTRAFRRLVGRVMVGIMLMAQLAIATYACPVAALAPMQAASMSMPAIGESMSQDRQTTPVQAAPAMHCGDMTAAQDSAHPVQCAAHCHADEKSSHVDVPQTPAPALMSLYIVSPTTVELVPPMSATAASVDTVAMPPPPPHAILHCCIRD